MIRLLLQNAGKWRKLLTKALPSSLSVSALFLGT